MTREAELQIALDLRESRVFAFDFTRDLPDGLTIASATITCDYFEGAADATPQSLVDGARVIATPYVLQKFTPHQAWTVYTLVCVATLGDGQKLTSAGILPIVKLGAKQPA